MAEAPRLEAVIVAVERIKGEKWEEFRERHGDAGRIWCSTWHGVCVMKLAALAKAVGLRNYAVVGNNAKRDELRLQNQPPKQN